MWQRRRAASRGACQSCRIEREFRGEAAAKAYQQRPGCLVVSHSWTGALLPDATSWYTSTTACTTTSPYLLLLLAGCSSVSCGRSRRCCQHVTAHKAAEAAAAKAELIHPAARLKAHRGISKSEAARVQTRRFCCSTIGSIYYDGPSRIERTREEEKERVSLVLPSITAGATHIQHRHREWCSCCGSSSLFLLSFVCIRGHHKGHLISHPVRSLHERGAGRESSESAVVVAAAPVRVYVHRAGTSNQDQKEGHECHETQQQSMLQQQQRQRVQMLHGTRHGGATTGQDVVYVQQEVAIRAYYSLRESERERARPYRVLFA